MGLLTKSSRPATAAMAKAIQVIGSRDSIVSSMRRPFDASPISRRSTTEIDPTTVTKAITCTHSIAGNSQSDSRIVVESCVVCSQLMTSPTALTTATPASPRRNRSSGQRR